MVSKKKYPEALKNYFLSLKLGEEMGEKATIDNAFANIGYLFTLQKKYAEAKKYFDSALTLSINMGNKEVIKSTYAYYTTLDSVTGNFKAAFSHNKLYVIYRDSLKNEEATRKMLSTQMGYEYDKKMAAEKAEQDKLNIIQAAENKRKGIITYSVLVILVLTVISAILLVNSQRAKHKKDKIISEKEKGLLQIEKQRVEDELSNAKNALDTYTRNMVEKNELLEQFKTDIENLKKIKSKELEEIRIEQLENLNKTTILTEQDWDKFRGLFENVYKGFFIRLKEKLPDLTNAETRLICLTKLKLDTKQMASILGVSDNTIKISRHRLRKKLGLSEADSITDIAESI